MLTSAQVRRACRRTPDADNLNSVMVALERYGPGVGLDLLQRRARIKFGLDAAFGLSVRRRHRGGVARRLNQPELPE